MINDIGGVTSQLIGLALDAASQRHDVIANNIANASTPGFKAKRLAFEGYLQEMMGGDSQVTDSKLASAEDLLQSGQAVVDTGKSVALDREMVNLAENTVRYESLIKAQQKTDDILRMAIREGRG